MSCYSFASSKHLTTLGQGGAICCDDDEQFDLLCRLKDHGRNDRQKGKAMSDEFNDWGTNLKFTEAAAVFGLVQLKHLKERQVRFQTIWKIYNDELSPHVNFLTEVPTWYVDIFVDFPVKLMEYLKLHGVGSRRYPELTSNQGVYKGPTNLYPNADYFRKSGLYLPSTTSLTDEQILDICKKIKYFFK